MWSPFGRQPPLRRSNSGRDPVELHFRGLEPKRVKRYGRAFRGREEQMEFRILGPLEVHDEGRQISLGGPKQCALLGVLLLHGNESISSERLVDELWGVRPPARAHKLVQGYVSGLRKQLGPARVVTRSPGYLVRVEAGELDALEFDRLVAEARTAEEPQLRAERLREALELWRGSALADVRLEGFAAREAERLNEQRLATLVDRIEADLELPPAPTPPPEPDRLRRTVSVVFGDLAGSTSLGERLDPESLHSVLDRYSETCAEVLERHGGTVEKFIGDAVVAVFGLPILHEDDALRAVRAAVELRQAVADLSAELSRTWGVGLGIKLAVNSGEVFVGPGSRREAFASGDAINVAARLEEAAAEGEILLGEQTKRLIDPAVRAEPLEPLSVRGRVAAVRAWRLLELQAGDLSQIRPPSTPFVGRSSELAALEQELERAVAEQGCRVCTIVGAPGVGKSRLVRQLVDKLGDDAIVVVGRCLSY